MSANPPPSETDFRAWIRRNQLALTFFSLVAGTVTAMLILFWLSYWDSFAFYVDRVKILIGQDARQLKSRVDDALAFDRDACGVLRENGGPYSYVTTAEIRSADTVICHASFTDAAPGKCANPSWREPVLYLHCDNLLQLPDRSGNATAPIVATDSDLTISVRLRDGSDLVVNRSHTDTLGTWRGYAEPQGRAFAIPLGAIALIAFAFWYMVVRRVTALARDARRAVRARVKDVGTHETEHFDELSILAHFRELLHQTDVQAEQVKSQNRELLRQNESLSRVRRMVGHEIYSPLQNLQALCATNTRALSQISRVRRATDAILSESASPATLKDADLAVFLTQWVANTMADRAVERLVYEGPHEGCRAKVDVEQLEDCLDHLVNNAADFRVGDTDIVVSLRSSDAVLTVEVQNQGPLIPDDALERIFDYGVSLRDAGGSGNLGQGLYQARLYASGMGGTVVARNLPPDRVSFIFSVPVASG